MKFWQFVTHPFYINHPSNWSVVNKSLCLVVDDDEENIITACYPELCILRKDWSWLWQREEQGIRVSERDT